MTKEAADATEAVRKLAKSILMKKAADYLHDLAVEELMSSLAHKKVAVATGKGLGVGGPAQGIAGTDTCTCASCGATAPHTRGTPCAEMTCPKCGKPMTGV